MTHIAILIVAAGSGSRIGGLPKQYRQLAGKPVLRRTLAAFQTVLPEAQIQVVIGAGQQELYAASVAGLGLPAPVVGGASRQESVRLGLDALAASAPDIVLIHDAARPLVTTTVIRSVLLALDSAAAAVPAVPIVDTLYKGADEIAQDVARDGLFAVQTPQGFHFQKIHTAHKNVAHAVTDDAAVARAARLAVKLVQGDPMNIKLTHEDDFRRAAEYLRQTKIPRTASGYDVHRFGAGDHVWLGGIKIPHTHGIIAHSDGDVALHALTDALLGTISAGDIGSHFPPSDPQWKNAASDKFLDHARALIAEKGGEIIHVDLTLICEKPKIRPHRGVMQQRIADILQIQPDQVSIKATTTEGLGFTGRGEGIAVQALATVLL
jgi:2-C-methyl-D-erythritol 4-phosphate cytidylyltransferase/2-C-methyl-D-erythritol 2,4-cyclodiphosphate synthase